MVKRDAIMPMSRGLRVGGCGLCCGGEVSRDVSLSAEPISLYSGVRVSGGQRTR